MGTWFMQWQDVVRGTWGTQLANKKLEDDNMTSIEN
jgi:hypothetical protein